MNAKMSRKPGTPILVGIGILLLLALLVALTVAGSNVRTYEAGTPEATAQAYIQALFDGDIHTGHGYLSKDLQQKCEPRDLDLWWVGHADSASFDEVRIDGDHAAIELRLVSSDYEPGAFPFDNYDNSQETELELDQLDDVWVITDATWPLAGCTWR
jgi:hypothetical protein